MFFVILKYHPPHLLEHGRHAPLVSHVHPFWVLVEHKVRVVLVHRVVRQMHANIVQIPSARRRVFLSSEPRQTLSVNVNSHRITPCNQHVNPQVKFKSLYQKRLVQIPLHNAAISRLDVLQISCKEYPPALTTGFGLYNKGFGLPLHELVFKVDKFGWEEPGLRKKFIVIRKLSSHFH